MTDPPDPAARPVSVNVCGHAVRPGDTIVVGTGAVVLTADNADRVRQALRDELPGVDVVVLAGLTVEAVYRPTTEGDQ